MKCPMCNDEMVSTREDYAYTECGLPNVTLQAAEVRRCPSCGESAVVIPRIEQLHRVLAAEVARRPGRLSPHEIRFLRKCLGWSSTDLATRFGVTPSTVSRWESPVAEKPMGAGHERLLRYLALHVSPPESYEGPEIVDLLDALSRPPARKSAPLFVVAGPKWRVPVAPPPAPRKPGPARRRADA